MTSSRVLEIQPLLLDQDDALKGTDEFSPYVWRDGETYRLAVRSMTNAQSLSDERSTIYFGISEDGQHFKVDTNPNISPSPGPDSWGCEDPTVIAMPDQIHVLYSGWDGATSRLLRASGPTLDSLTKMGEVLHHHPHFPMSKEAAVLPSGKGLQLLFEYATEGASRIGMAIGTSLTEQFRVTKSQIPPREDRWDSWHLSPCDCIEWQGRRIAIYSGSDRDARWRIGWVEFDHHGDVILRAKEPLIAPFDLAPGDTDIAFAASALVVGDALWIYFSLADRKLYRARVEIGTDGETPEEMRPSPPDSAQRSVASA